MQMQVFSVFLLAFISIVSVEGGTCTETIHYHKLEKCKKMSVHEKHHTETALRDKWHHLVTYKKGHAPKSITEMEDGLQCNNVELVPARSYKVYAKLGEILRLSSEKGWVIKDLRRLHATHSRLEGLRDDTSSYLIDFAEEMDGFSCSGALRLERVGLTRYFATFTDPSVAAREIKSLLAKHREISLVRAYTPATLTNKMATSITQSDDPGARPLWDNPYGKISGSGQIVMVGDTGVDVQSCFFSDPLLSVAVYPNVSYDHRKIISYKRYENYEGTIDMTDAVGHGSHVTGSLAGNTLSQQTDYNGLAPDAKVFFYDMSHTSIGLTLPYDLRVYFATGRDIGAKVSHNSWGNGKPEKYVTLDSEADEFMFKHSDFTVVAAAGNGGVKDGVLSPASAKNVIAVGSHMNVQLESGRSRSFTSAAGPTWDHRIKPEIMAPGNQITSAHTSGLTPSATCKTDKRHGTSMAAPFVSAAAALIRQYFMEGWHPRGQKDATASMVPANTLVKAMILHSGRSGNAASYIDAYTGFGRMALQDILYFSGTQDWMTDKTHVKIAHNQTLGQDGVYKYAFLTDGNIAKSLAKTVKVTLVWSDPPAAKGSAKALVNDLDLVLKKADGSIVRSVTATQQTGYDRVNVVEQVTTEAVAGAYTVYVYGYHVVEHGAYDGVPFSLVVTAPGIEDTDDIGCPGDCGGPSRGTCMEGTCQCDIKYHHVDCSLCSSEVYCNNNGVCVGNNQCKCDANFQGTRCETCVHGMYGPNCDNKCSCNNHGTCGPLSGDPLEKHCTCHGNWAGELCEYCKPGFLGKDCETPAYYCKDKEVVEITDISGWVHINGEHHYENSLRCMWLFDVAPTATVQLKFTSFDIEVSYDHVWVYKGSEDKGHPVVEYNGRNGDQQSVEVTGPTLVVFESDLIGPGAGFEMKFYSGNPTVAPATASPITPTDVPTTSPPAIPTAAPTALPTSTPTTIPTVAPTTVPTAGPTTAPTASPTEAPTALPTAGPTTTPTAVPTAGPTTAPTALPTAGPTTTPTASPTETPTTAPTGTRTGTSGTKDRSQEVLVGVLGVLLIVVLGIGIMIGKWIERRKQLLNTIPEVHVPQDSESELETTNESLKDKVTL